MAIRFLDEEQNIQASKPKVRFLDEPSTEIGKFVESGRTPESPQTLPEVATSLTRLVTPPKSIQDLFLEKPMQAEELGQTVKSSVKGVIGGKLQGSPILAKTGQIATDIVPFTPSGFSGAAVGEFVSGGVQEALKVFPTKIANRFFKQASNAAVDRLKKGAPTLGEEVLFSPDLKDFRIDDKKKIFDIAQNKISSLAKDVESKIRGAIKGGETIDKSDLGDVTVVNNVLDRMIPEFKELGMNRRDYIILKNLRDKNKISIFNANYLRELFGKEVGKKFISEQSAVSPLTAAQEEIWKGLRNVLSTKVPNVSPLLQKQHVLYEISHAVAKDAAAGVGASSQLMAGGGAIAGGALGSFLGGTLGAGVGAPIGMAVGVTASRLSKQMSFANIVKKMLDAQGVGATVAAAGQTALKNIKRGSKND